MGPEFEIMEAKNRSVCKNAVTGIWRSCRLPVMADELLHWLQYLQSHLHYLQEKHLHLHYLVMIQIRTVPFSIVLRQPAFPTLKRLCFQTKNLSTDGKRVFKFYHER